PLLGAGDDLARVDADAQLEAGAVAALELVVQRAETLAELLRRSQRPQRVVLVHRRHAEDGHHRVADELLDGAAMPFEDPLRDLEVARHHGAQALRIDPLAERGRARDVAEEYGDCLPGLAKRCYLAERRRAGVAEPCTVSV